MGEAERCCHEVRFETCRCVKKRLRVPLGELTALYQTPYLDLGQGNREGKGLGREKERNGERKREGEELKLGSLGHCLGG